MLSEKQLNRIKNGSIIGVIADVCLIADPHPVIGMTIALLLIVPMLVSVHLLNTHYPLPDLQAENKKLIGLLTEVRQSCVVVGIDGREIGATDEPHISDDLFNRISVTLQEIKKG